MSDKENEKVDEAFGELLANFVRQNPCLYDKKCKQYKDKKFVADTWSSIASACNMSDLVDTVQRQWKILRNQFTREHRLMMTYEPSGTGNDTSKIPRKTWYLYDSLFFLASHVAHRNTCSNFVRRNTMMNQSSPSSSKSASQLTSVPLASEPFSTLWNSDLVTVSDDSNVSTSLIEISMKEVSTASATPTTSSTSFSQSKSLATTKKNLISPPPDQFAAKKMKGSQRNEEQLSEIICSTTKNINKFMHNLTEKRSQAVNDDGEEAAMAKTLIYALKRVNSKYKIQCYMECLSIIDKYHNMTAEETIQNL
ncbi:PREDICTED: transcription factor Adf-1-like [Trachymyrmex cornetzi]|uniref:transcription factor Adf-1-like n=1 Tax=Trachymyrmex cornetzi TaxID=471704 RepID=UPI00084F0EA0|nr:PREDICTED: transcription factor Adf-1-like [Trachymyrmex cornetzi]